MDTLKGVLAQAGKWVATPFAIALFFLTVSMEWASNKLFGD
jgi:hypothetical protein